MVPSLAVIPFSMAGPPSGTCEDRPIQEVPVLDLKEEVLEHLPHDDEPG